MPSVPPRAPAPAAPAAMPARPARRDAVVAAACWVLTAGSMVVLPWVASVDPDLSDAAPALGSATWWVGVVVLTAQAGVLLWARRAPQVVLVLVAALALAVSGAGLGAVFSLTSVAVIVAAYVAVVERSVAAVRLSAAAAAVLTVAAYAVVGAADDELSRGAALASALGQGLVVVGGPVLVALAASTRRQVRLAQEHELQALAREQDALVREARAQERTAMARELHDIAAHHLSGIAIMAAAIERQIATDPGAATEGVRQVRSQSTAVLRDLRRLVGILREGDAAELAVENLRGIAALTAPVVGRGPVRLEVLTADDASLGAGLGPLAQLTAYRMVQEALANAARHAPGAPCRVTVDDRGADVVVTVHNDAAASAPRSGTGEGFGLVGMRERADLTAAELRYGPTVDGGWDVVLRLRRDTTGSEQTS